MKDINILCSSLSCEDTQYPFVTTEYEKKNNYNRKIMKDSYL